jgi:A/G-specific adenine glycosylase
MAQQTQVARVLPHYERWLARWPTAAALAAATPAEVLCAWVGLGYNRRALGLHAAATAVARDGWPQDLRELPGVGPYTAAAVGSFAFGRQRAAIDTNVRRVATRFAGTEHGLAERVAGWLPDGRADTFNQAMMELGATVCTSRAPRCDACPVRRGCAGHVVPRPRRRRGSERFEDSDRWARGRIVAALVAGEPLPELAPERRERALAGLERDGLVVRDGDRVRLP